MRLLIGRCLATHRRDLKDLTFILIMFYGQTSFPAHSLLMLSTLDFLNSLTPLLYNTFFWHPVLPAFLFHDLSSSWTLFRSLCIPSCLISQFPFPAGEVIDIIRVILHNLTSRWKPRFAFKAIYQSHRMVFGRNVVTSRWLHLHQLP